MGGKLTVFIRLQTAYKTYRGYIFQFGERRYYETQEVVILGL